jgi:SAM-dependent methyltransferase
MYSSMRRDGKPVAGRSLSSKLEIEHRLTQLSDAEKAKTCGHESRRTYLEMHKARFADILHLCQRQVPDASARVLDIGRSELTAYLLNFYQNIHTLGLDPSLDNGGHREVSKMDTVPHLTFDLLNSHTISSWPECGSFELIVFSEVIEHLCIAPEFILGALSSLLTDQGILICTTPNAADISKRLRLAFGCNPYERLRLYSTNPGHIREYTKRELREIAHSVGLRCMSHSYLNWIQDRGGSRIKTSIMKLLRVYPPFRSFQTCVLTKEQSVLPAHDSRVPLFMEPYRGNVEQNLPQPGS